MKVTVVANMTDAGTMLRKRGLEPGGRVQKIFTSECARHMDPYVPMQSGILKNTRDIEDDGITYRGPYARNMYYGKVMVDPVTKAAGFLTEEGWRSRKGVRKIVSNREYVYHGGGGNPARGKLWDVRMWADRGRAILNAIAKAAGGKAE